MFVRALSASTLAILVSFVAGCAEQPEASTDLAESAATETTFVPPVLPHPGGAGDEAAWGGDDSARWRPEATLANAASRALDDAWHAPGGGVRDVLVALPLRFWGSDLHPYGDGQSNAVPSFEGFPAAGRVPVVATLVHRKNGPSEVRFRFDRALGGSTAIEILSFADGGATRREISGNVEETTGDVIASAVASESWMKGAFAVHPRGWQDWFPISFEHPTEPAARFRDLLDRERVGRRENPNATTSAFERLSSRVFSASYNGAGPNGRPVPYTPADVHGRFPFFNRSIVTSVGAGFMWVADEKPAGYKTLYACFTGRRANDEASAPDGGVASGAGFHRIGDPTETIVNDLEDKPFIVAFGRGNPLSAAALPTGGFAWGLGDVVTVRWLRPAEAFVTPRGSNTQPSYHAFFFAQKENVCAELLTHPEGAR